MPSFPLDIEPEQIIRWALQETSAESAAVEAEASVGREAREFLQDLALDFGDLEIEDLSEVTTIAVLEIRPRSPADQWSIVVLVEDDIGPRVAEADEEEADSQIGLETFNDMFIRPGRGTVYLSANAANAASRSRLDRVLSDIEKDRHPG